nr:probable E3 ubiquitin-protein ligase ATL44 [Lolium perenne]
MLNLYPRFSASFRSRDGDDEDVSKLRAFYGIAVACVAILLFCCVLAATSSALKAGSFAATAALLLVVLGCLAPRALWLRRRRRAGRTESPVLALTAAARGGCTCDAPPAFAFECSLEEGGGISCEGEEAVPGCVVVCPVCLEGIYGGEMVRQLPACRHVFHVECIDMWLHSHRTCPMCRCVISPAPTVTAKALGPEEALESSDEALPPV